VSVAPSPAANRAAASASPDALASAEGGLLPRSASLGPATPAARSAPAPLQPHDPDTDDEEGGLADGDAGSQGPDADDEAEAAGEADGEDIFGGSDAEPPRSLPAQQQEEGAVEDLSQAPSRSAPHPVAPPSPGLLTAWLCRYCQLEATPFGDTVTIVCQAREAPRGCCWHLGCLRGEEERNAARRALMVPHSRWACPACRVGVVALGPPLRLGRRCRRLRPRRPQSSPCLTDAGSSVAV